MLKKKSALDVVFGTCFTFCTTRAGVRMRGTDDASMSLFSHVDWRHASRRGIRLAHDPACDEAWTLSLGGFPPISVVHRSRRSG